MTAAHANDQAFPMTEPGVIEIKTLPAGRLLACEGEGDYFSQSNNLFGPLFRYIQKNGISMTTPVEARMRPGTMFFWVAPGQVDKADEETAAVKVVDIGERTVAAIGARGSYSGKNFEEARDKLLQWIDARAELHPTGDPYAVFWNGPFMPGPLKKFEVHLEVRRDAGGSG